MRSACNSGRIVFTAGYTLDEVTKILRAYSDEELIRVAKELRGCIIDSFIERYMGPNYIRTVGLENIEYIKPVMVADSKPEGLRDISKIDEWDEYFRERKKEAEGK